VIELCENRRQIERWERDALALLRDGHGNEALQRYERHGRVVVGEDADAVRQRLVADWWAARDPDESVMIAHRRVDVADLNGRARALMRAAGALAETELPLAAGGFAAGERVVLRRNDRSLGVANGDRGTVTAVDPVARALDVELAGRPVRLDAGYLDSAARNGPALQHAYAITGHVAQGLTFRETFVLATEQVSREWAYSAMSRGRDANRLYAIGTGAGERDEYAPAGEATRGPRERLETALGRSAAHTLAVDVGGAQRMAAELRRVVAERDAAVADHDAAMRARAELQRQQPHSLRRRSRREHRQAVARALGAEAYSARRADSWREREATVRRQLEELRREESRGVEIERRGWATAGRRLGLERPERVLDRAVDGGRGLGR